MDFPLLASVAGFAFASCGTPGPNNMLLTNSATRFGYRPTLKLLLGIMFGLQLLMLLTALGLGQLFLRWPSLQWGLKIVGSGYLLWLAWNISRASAKEADETTATMSWQQGALFQFLNPKAWLMAVSAISGFTLAGEQYWPSAWTVLAIFLSLGLVTGHIWAFLGLNLRRWLHTPTDWQRFNYAMALLTAASVFMIWR
ncbi:LysE family translocator [Oceanisphaera pacifica]|uniref:LysE family translocator n=1 Tax=Oceanisphaera pacifica TaxID=2818389 RepID=A0ABS3NCU6_9GAMM|nr:LysE family translocator [Oceanisphaera pacifica]MBO1518360.1 LysE family translocator [Oceanisphaera pacifica]